VTGGCYGYFEFLLADIETGNLTGLHKVEYHNDVVERFWSGCTPGSSVYIGTVLPSPGQNKFAFTVKPTETCYPNPDKSQAYVVDFSTLPVGITEIPLADGISWSPSGAILTYYVKDACQVSTCVTSVYIQSIYPASTPTRIEQASLFHTTPLFTAWLDDHTVMYQWRPSESSEGPYYLIWYDINNNNKVSSPLPQNFLQNGMFYLSREQSHLLGLSYPGSVLLGLSMQKEYTVLADFPAFGPIFYNSRFSGYIFTRLQGADVTVIDAELDQFSLNLSNFIPSSTGETFVYVSPGGNPKIAPEANAGPDQTVTASSTGTALVTLDGSGSLDSDGTIAAYQWRENDTLIADGVTPQVELGVGEHTITLTVVDEDGAIDTDEVLIIVNAPTPTLTPTPTVPPSGNGTGLRGQYFNKTSPAGAAFHQERNGPACRLGWSRLKWGAVFQK
jgi:hypothetical protein